MRIAAIDVGSNSIHMVVAEVEADGRFRVLDRAKEMVRLGRRSLTSGRLTAEAMHAGIRALTVFKTLAERQGVERFKAVATSAVREADNGGDFIQRIRDEVGLRVKVIPGREEARLIYLGVRHAVDLRGTRALIVDIGGGSVELVLTEDERVVALDSLKLGVARLSETFLERDPPSAKDVAALDDHLAEHLDTALARMGAQDVGRVIGTSGTMLNVITLAGHLRGEPPDGHLNNFTVSADEIAKVRRTLVKSDREARLRLKGLDAKRVDLIVAGGCLADRVAKRVDATEFVACTWSLREGVLLDFIARHRRGIEETERYADPRRRSVERLARHLGEVDAHGRDVARLSLQLFDQLRDDLGLPDAGRDLLEFAALLHDIGHHIGHAEHQRHSHYLISNGELLGFRRDEVDIIALTARYHQKALPRDGDEHYAALPKADRRTVRALSAILRVADGLDRSHYSVVRQIVVARRSDRLVFQLSTAGEDAELEIWEARRRAALLEDLLGRPIDFKVVTPADRHAADRVAAAAH